MDGYWWKFFATFGGPLATVVASFAAIIVTATFGIVQTCMARAQLRIAREQRQIAEEQRYIAAAKFNFDLSAKRLAVFEAARDLLDEITTNGVAFANEAINAYNFKTADAVFLFDADVVDYLADFKKKALHARTLGMQLQRFDGSQEERAKLADEAGAEETKVGDELPRMIEKFKPYLTFKNFNPPPPERWVAPR